MTNKVFAVVIIFGKGQHVARRSGNQDSIHLAFAPDVWYTKIPRKGEVKTHVVSAS